jgi:hypothetical protein
VCVKQIIENQIMMDKIDSLLIKLHNTHAMNNKNFLFLSSFFFLLLKNKTPNNKNSGMDW